MKTQRIATLFALLLALLTVNTGCAVDMTDAESVSSASTEVRKPGSFNLFRATDGEYYFNLKAGNGQIVLQSEGYVSKSGAKNGIASVKNNGVDLDSYKLLKASNGEWYFNLRAKNYKVIGTSELYSTKGNAKRGTKTVRNVIAKVLHLEAALEGGAAFDLFTGNDEQFYFHLEAANHEIVLQSEGYVAKAGALNGIDSVRENGRDEANYELREASNGEWYFVLKAQNHEIIGMSEMYSTKYNAERAIESVAELIHSERVANPE